MVAIGEPAAGLPGVTAAAPWPDWLGVDPLWPVPALLSPLKATAIEVSQTSSGTIAEMSRITEENRTSRL
jgi:hypothetical protein